MSSLRIVFLFLPVFLWACGDDGVEIPRVRHRGPETPAPPPAQARISAGDVERLAREAAALAERWAGRRFEKRPAARLVERRVLAEALQEWVLPLIPISRRPRGARKPPPVRGKGEDEAEARAVGAFLAERLGAFYAGSRRGILVSPPAPRGREAGEIPRQVVRAEILREALRALDARMHGTARRLREAPDGAVLNVRLALGFGHAAWAAEEILAAEGHASALSPVLSRFRRGAKPLPAVLEGWRSRMLFALNDGRLFFRSMARSTAGDPSAVIFAHPPDSPAKLLDPRLYRVERKP